MQGCSCKQLIEYAGRMLLAPNGVRQRFSYKVLSADSDVNLVSQSTPT